jgi:hypothetical protein
MRSPLLIILVVALAHPVFAQPAPYPADAPLVWPASVTRSSPADKRPWKALVVEAVVPRKVESGALVTIVPLTRLAPQNRAVTSVQAQDPVPGFPPTYQITVDGAVKAYLEARPAAQHTEARPFDALLVSPPHPKARVMKTVKDLPSGNGVSAATLAAALDLDADGKADATVFRYCCETPTAAPVRSAPSPCSPECEAIYLRGKDGAWKPVHQASDD